MVLRVCVTSHTGCVSRNIEELQEAGVDSVTSHTGCVSRNLIGVDIPQQMLVTSHTGCVSRNIIGYGVVALTASHIPHGMCE